MSEKWIQIGMQKLRHGLILIKITATALSLWLLEKYKC